MLLVCLLPVKGLNWSGFFAVLEANKLIVLTPPKKTQKILYLNLHGQRITCELEPFICELCGACFFLRKSWYGTRHHP